MSVAGTFLRSRQVLMAVLMLLASGALVWFGGDLNLPVPGADVPIILGTLAPQLNSWAVISCADGAYRWAEDLAPRDVAGPRTALMCGLSAMSIVLVLLPGAYSIGPGASVALACGFLVLIGLGTIGWAFGGRAGGFLLPFVFTLVCISLGTTSRAYGVAPWALLLVPPGAPGAIIGAAAGASVAVGGWWIRDRAVRRLRRTRLLAALGHARAHHA